MFLAFSLLYYIINSPLLSKDLAYTGQDSQPEAVPVSIARRSSEPIAPAKTDYSNERDGAHDIVAKRVFFLDTGLIELARVTSA